MRLQICIHRVEEVLLPSHIGIAGAKMSRCKPFFASQIMYQNLALVLPYWPLVVAAFLNFTFESVRLL